MGIRLSGAVFGMWVLFSAHARAEQTPVEKVTTSTKSETKVDGKRAITTTTTYDATGAIERIVTVTVLNGEDGKEVSRQTTVESRKPKAEQAESPFPVVKLVGDANLATGSLSGASGDDVSSGALGLYAESRFGQRCRLNGNACTTMSFLASFSFGSEGKTRSGADRESYFNFLRSPASSLGGLVQVQVLRSVGRRKWLWMGGGLSLRASSLTFQYQEDSRSQDINLIGVDPSFILDMRLRDDTDLKVSLRSEVGLSSRYWNKPSRVFVEDLGLKDDAHAFFGPRVASMIAIGDIRVGIEMSRYWGGELERFKEFAIIPYVGIAGGIGINTPKKPAAVEEAARAPDAPVSVPTTPITSR
jgi:hypothetical protein